MRLVAYQPAQRIAAALQPQRDTKSIKCKPKQAFFLHKNTVAPLCVSERNFTLQPVVLILLARTIAVAFSGLYANTSTPSTTSQSLRTPPDLLSTCFSHKSTKPLSHMVLQKFIQRLRPDPPCSPQSKPAEKHFHTIICTKEPPEYLPTRPYSHRKPHPLDAQIQQHNLPQSSSALQPSHAALTCPARFDATK